MMMMMINSQHFTLPWMPQAEYDEGTSETVDVDIECSSSAQSPSDRVLDNTVRQTLHISLCNNVNVDL